MTGDRHSGNVRFGPFLLQGGERRLLRDGTPLALESRCFDVLAMLAAHAGTLVTKDALLAQVWSGRIVEEGNLHVCVSTLRKLLGKDAIVTVPRHGYRFMMPVAAFAIEQPLPAQAEHNLPQALASFVGREDDLARLALRLMQARLVTIGGIGGSGKTRLAIELAMQVLPSFPDGVRFVDLAQVAESDAVGRAIAAGLGLRDARGRSVLDTLVQHCRDRRLLLVLDNCEHVASACTELLVPLLSGTSALRVLATSRERLGVPGEVSAPLRALTAPAPGATPDPAVLVGYESVRLFVERAQLLAPEFVLDAANAADVAEICRRLDGLPLALELAAALVELLSVAQIRDRLDDRLRLLDSGARRHDGRRSLLATLASSYACLAEGEQRLLTRLSMFAGGCTLAAAAEVAGDGDEIATLRLIGRLVDKSLVHVDRGGTDGPRYTMLETVREFARGKLVERGDEEATRRRHLDHFAAFARSAQAGIFGDAMRVWLARVDAELPNLLAACAACDGAPDGVARGLELAYNLRSYWLAHGRFDEGQRVYESALARQDGDARSMQRGRTLYALGQHCYVRGRLQEALAPTSEALSIAREHGDDELTVYCLDRLALAASWLGDIAAARAHAADELRVATRTGNPRLVGFALTAQGSACRADGDFDAAARAFEEALALFERGTDRNNRHNALIDVARVSIARNDLARARETLAAALALVAESGTSYRGHFALDAGARLAAACADWTRAARLQGASDGAVDAAGGTRTWFDDRVLAILQAKPAQVLSADAYAAAYAGGRALPLPAALAEASAWLGDAGLWPDGRGK